MSLFYLLCVISFLWQFLHNFMRKSFKSEKSPCAKESTFWKSGIMTLPLSQFTVSVPTILTSVYVTAPRYLTIPDDPEVLPSISSNTISRLQQYSYLLNCYLITMKNQKHHLISHLTVQQEAKFFFWFQYKSMSQNSHICKYWSMYIRTVPDILISYNF